MVSISVNVRHKIYGHKRSIDIFLVKNLIKDHNKQLPIQLKNLPYIIICVQIKSSFIVFL